MSIVSVVFQYSPNGVDDWSTTPSTATRFIRTSSDGGATFGPAILYAPRRARSNFAELENRLVDEPQEPISMPIDASLSLTRTQVIFIIGQLVAASGALITFLGLGETVWIVRLTRFLQANEATPVIAAAATGIAFIVLLIRNRRRAIERAVMASLLPNRLATTHGKAHPAVVAAIDEAIQVKIVGAPQTKEPS